MLETELPDGMPEPGPFLAIQEQLSFRNSLRMWANPFRYGQDKLNKDRVCSTAKRHGLRGSAVLSSLVSAY